MSEAKPPKPAGFDDRQWPVHVALVTLGSLVAGMILADGRWEDPRWLHNGWFRLGLLSVTLVVLFGLTAQFGRRYARRGQLAMLLSLVLHLGLAFYLSDQILSLAAIPESPPQPPPVEQPRSTVSEYALHSLDRPRQLQAFEQPLDATLPNPNDQQPIDKRTTNNARPRTIARPSTLQAAKRQTQPSATVIKRELPAAPKRSETKSRLSKQRELVVTASPDAVWLPPQAARPSPVRQPAAPALADRADRSSKPRPPRIGRVPVQHDTRSTPAVQLAERATRSPRSVPMSSFTLPRRSAISAQMLPDAIAVEQPLRPRVVTPVQAKTPRTVGRPVPLKVDLPDKTVRRPIGAQVTGPTIKPPVPTVSANPSRALALDEARPTLAKMPKAQQGRAVRVATGKPIRVELPEVADRLADRRTATPQATAPRLAKTRAGVPVHVLAETGPGGLGVEVSPSVGVPDRLTHRDAQTVHLGAKISVRKQTGGPASIEGVARHTTEAFVQRGLRRHAAQAGASGAAAQTEAAIEEGLDFLARWQLPNGSWSFQHAGEENSALIRSDTAATGLALLAFLGAGYDHLEAKHQTTIRNALDFLIEHQQANGDFYLDQDKNSSRVAHLYSHAIATIAFCEAFGMTGDAKIGQAAGRAIGFVVDSQHKTRGGWRYAPGRMSDLSVTGWQLMALKSGQLARLQVSPLALDRAELFLRRCQGTGNRQGFFAYNPYASNRTEQRHGRQPSTVMTSVGMLMRLYTGWNREHPAMIRGAQHLLRHLPAQGTDDRRPPIGTMGNPLRDTYYWYYATQVMYHMRGTYWQAWNDTLHPLLTETQVKQGPLAGSWDPRWPVPDRWGLHGGRIYVTTMNLLSLEVGYRHLPIYEEAGR